MKMKQINIVHMCDMFCACGIIIGVGCNLQSRSSGYCVFNGRQNRVCQTFGGVCDACMETQEEGHCNG